MKNVKRISKVTIKRMVDESPDTSWLGKYSDDVETEYAIDRAHDLDCIAQPYNQLTSEASDHIQSSIEYLEALYDQDFTNLPVSTRLQLHTSESNSDARVILEALRDSDCNCTQGGSWDRREYRYFNGPVENHKGESPENIRKYVRQDYERMERLNRGDWCFIGVRAEAEILVPSGNDSSIVQEIRSSGLWGVESDSDGSCLKEIQDEQLSELREQLHSLGFSKRAAARAIKDAVRANV